jgi:hypothetical protein
MSRSSPSAGVLSPSQRTQNTNGKRAGNHDEEFLEHRPPNQGRHILTLLTACAHGADSLLISVIPSPSGFYRWLFYVKRRSDTVSEACHLHLQYRVNHRPINI